MTECTLGTEAMRDALPALAHGTLGAPEAARLRAHLAECAACADEFAVLGAAGRVLSAATPTVDTAAIVRALPRPQPAALRLVPRSRPRWMPRQYLAAAASLLLVGALSVPLVRSYFNADPDASLPGGVRVANAGAAAPADLLGVSDLDALDTDELTALLAELDALEATVAAEPITMRQPLVAVPEDL